jgi:hypothetical protein
MTPPEPTSWTTSAAVRRLDPTPRPEGRRATLALSLALSTAVVQGALGVDGATVLLGPRGGDFFGHAWWPLLDAALLVVGIAALTPMAIPARLVVRWAARTQPGSIAGERRLRAARWLAQCATLLPTLGGIVIFVVSFLLHR